MKQAQISLVKESKFTEYADTIIGHDVWIGARAIIADGITVGNGAVVYSGAVVTKDVEPYSIVAGVPATKIRMRFTEEEIEKLLAIRWWDKDLEWLEQNADAFLDIKQFVRLEKLLP